MAGTRPGNGSTKFEIGIKDMGGWVRVTADGSPPNPNELAMYVSHGLKEWYRQQSHLRLICVTSINRAGDTVELHSWYEQHVFPDTSGVG